MKKTVLYCLPLLLFLAVTAAFRTTPAEDDLQLVRGIYRGMNRTPKGKEVFYTSFTVSSTLREAPDNNSKVSVSKAEMLVSEKQSRYISKEVEVYMDNDDAFTVLPGRKMLYWSDSNRKEGREKKIQQVPVLHDSLFALCRVTESRAVKEDGADRRIVLAPKKGKTLFGVSRYIFYVNSKTQQLEKVITEYPSDHRFERVEIDYHSFDFQYNAPAMFKPVKPLFVSGKSSLQPAYKSYKLVDNRKKSAQNQPH